MDMRNSIIAMCAAWAIGAACGRVQGSEEAPDAGGSGPSDESDSSTSCSSGDCCADGDAEPCGLELGICSAGVRVCANGIWGACIGAVGPEAEACDGQDDDCDGVADEDFALGVACDGADTDLCREGTTACSDDETMICTDATEDSVEVCDLAAMDEDCDGATDQGCDCLGSGTNDCGQTDVGACQLGTQTCVDGKWSECAGEMGPVAETCNFADDDCDGPVDEGFHIGQLCDGPGDGDFCLEGTIACHPNGSAVCVDTTDTTSESCNGADDDCDGVVDDGCHLVSLQFHPNSYYQYGVTGPGFNCYPPPTSATDCQEVFLAGSSITLSSDCTGEWQTWSGVTCAQGPHDTLCSFTVSGPVGITLECAPPK